MFDETDCIESFRAFSLARMLMRLHPRIGAGEYSIAIGDPGRLMVGWNEMRHANGRARYVEITSEGAGRTTLTRPLVPADQINVIEHDDLPWLATSAARLQLDALVRQAPRVPWTEEFIYITLPTIDDFGHRPLGLDQTVDRLIEERLTRLEQHASDLRRYREAFILEVTDLIDDYLGLRITGRYVANVVGPLLVRLAYISARCVASDVWVYVAAELDHIASLIGEKSDARSRRDLASFHWETYLSLLYSEIVCLIGNEVRAKAPQGSIAATRIERGARYVDEFAAHVLNPTLVEPQEFFPIGLREQMHRSPTEQASTHYAGLSAAVGTDSQRTWERVTQYSRSASSHFQWNRDEARALLCDELRGTSSLH